MCTGYWETCRCNDCEKAKELLMLVMEFGKEKLSYQ